MHDAELRWDGCAGPLQVVGTFSEPRQVRRVRGKPDQVVHDGEIEDSMGTNLLNEAMPVVGVVEAPYAHEANHLVTRHVNRILREADGRDDHGLSRLEL